MGPWMSTFLTFDLSLIIFKILGIHQLVLYCIFVIYAYITYTNELDWKIGMCICVGSCPETREEETKGIWRKASAQKSDILELEYTKTFFFFQFVEGESKISVRYNIRLTYII